MKNTLILGAGIIIGACLHYCLFNKSVSYIKDKAYAQGQYDKLEQIVNSVLSSDSTSIDRDGITYFHEDSTLIYERDIVVR